MVHSVSACMQGVQVKLWDPLRTCASSALECLRGVFTMRHYTNPRLPFFTLPLPYHGFKHCVGLSLWYTFGAAPRLSWEIQHIFLTQNLGATNEPVSQRWGTQLHQILGQSKSLALLAKFVLVIRCIASFRNWSVPESQIRPNFDMLIPYTNYGSVSKVY